MLNEEKIRLMTKAASFESGEGKKVLAMNRYFRGDYISIHLIEAWISYTIAFCLCGGLWVLYNMDELMENINTIDLPAMGKHITFLYVGLLGVFLVINYVVCHIRYRRNRKKLAVFNHILKRISHVYQTEARNGGSGNTLGGIKEDDDFT